MSSQSADHWHIDGLVDVPVPAVAEHRVQELHLWNLHSLPPLSLSTTKHPLCR